MSIRCIVVTPEKTELDRQADSISLPMYDGELGVLRGRAPMIGRLGYGVLKLQTAAGPERYYVDGGFAQIENDEVNLLTGTLTPVDLLDSGEAQAELEKAVEMPGSTPAEMQIKQTAVEKARGKVRAAR